MTGKSIIPAYGEFIRNPSHDGIATGQSDIIRDCASRAGLNLDMIYDRIFEAERNGHGGAELMCKPVRKTENSVTFKITGINNRDETTEVTLLLPTENPAALDVTTTGKRDESAEMTLWLPRHRAGNGLAGKWVLGEKNDELPYEFHVVLDWKQQSVFHDVQIQALNDCYWKNNGPFAKPVTATRWKSIFGNDDAPVGSGSENSGNSENAMKSMPKPEPALGDEPVLGDEPAIMMDPSLLAETAAEFQDTHDEYFYLAKTSPNARATRINCGDRNEAESYAAAYPVIKEILEYRNGRFNADSYRSINGWQWVEPGK